MANSLKRTAEETIRQSMRENGVTQSYGITEAVADMMDSVQVDRTGLMNSLTQIVQGNSANPLNALLDLFGFRLIRKNAAQRELDGLLAMDAIETGGTGSLMSYLCLDEGAARAAADRMTKNIGEDQRLRAEEQHEQLERVNMMQVEISRLRQELEQLQAQTDRQRTMIAEQIQYILSQLGPQDPQTRLLTELMDDMELTVCWDSEGREISEAGMFSTLRCKDPEGKRIKPCILAGDRVLVKGLKFIAE